MSRGSNLAGPQRISRVRRETFVPLSNAIRQAEELEQKNQPGFQPRRT